MRGTGRPGADGRRATTPAGRAGRVPSLSRLAGPLAGDALYYPPAVPRGRFPGSPMTHDQAGWSGTSPSWPSSSIWSK